MFSFICTCTEPNLHQQVVQLLVAKSGPFFVVFNVEGLQIHLSFLFALFSLFILFLLSKFCLFWANSSSSEITFTLRLFDAILNKFPRNKVVYILLELYQPISVMSKLYTFGAHQKYEIYRFCFIQSHLSITMTG